MPIGLGYMKEIKNEGMPMAESINHRGNLYVKLNIALPNKEQMNPEVVNVKKKKQTLHFSFLFIFVFLFRFFQKL